MIVPVSESTYKLMERISVLQQQEIVDLKSQVAALQGQVQSLEEWNRTLLIRIQGEGPCRPNVFEMPRRP